MRKTVKQALSWATSKLKEFKISTPSLDAELLLAHVMGKTREHLLSHPKEHLTEVQISNFKFQISRRSLTEPIAYILEKKEFYGLDFKVTKDTLIPRPETELLVDEALDLLHNMLCNKMAVVDIGTGSGNIIISLAKSIQELESSENINMFAVDSSRKALAIAKQNAEYHGFSDSINFLSGRFLNPLIDNPSVDIQKSQLVILANLPYLSEDVYKSSPISVKSFEPKEALLSGQDGLDHYHKLLGQMKLLVDSYRLPLTALFEISPEQKSLIVRRIKSQLPEAMISLKKDLAGKWRLVKIEIP